MTIDSTNLVKVSIAAGAAAAALAFAAAPQASASAAAESVHGFTSTGMEFINSNNGVLAECGNQFSGRVTADDGSGEVKAAIDNILVSCSDGTRVTPNALPWTLDLLKDRDYTIDGVDLNITTVQGNVSVRRHSQRCHGVPGRRLRPARFSDPPKRYLRRNRNTQRECAHRGDQYRQLTNHTAAGTRGPAAVPSPQEAVDPTRSEWQGPVP